MNEVKDKQTMTNGKAARRTVDALRLPDCYECARWFLGCLNGRETWADKAKTPNIRDIGKSGKIYGHMELGIPASEYPMRTICDDFEWDPNPDRQGRVVETRGSNAENQALTH